MSVHKLMCPHSRPKLPHRAPPTCAELLRALADETRLGIVRVLLDGARHVNEIGSELGVEQSLLSHHLRALREAGIVDAERDGRSVLYALAPDVAVRQRGIDRLDLGCCELTFR